MALLDTGETTDAAFRLLKWWIKLHGIPMAIYVDLKSLYISPKSLRHNDEDEFVEPEWLTHFSRACKTLGIEVIKAYSPQAQSWGLSKPFCQRTCKYGRCPSCFDARSKFR